MPRRRRGAKAAAVEADAERGLMMSIFLHSPKDTVAGVLAFAAVSAIIANALFLQAGRHPSPMFGASTAAVSPMPRPRPVEATASVDSKPAEPKLAEPRLAEPKPADPVASPVRSSGAPAAAPPSAARPPAPALAATHSEPAANLPPAARRVAAVQRALTEFGYGQLKPTGAIGADTQAAIQKFERERKIAVTGQISDRLVRELATVTGRPIE
jgi:hypothetical protein